MAINYRYNFQSLSKFYFLRYFHLICLTVKENASTFFLSQQVLVKIIGFKITIYLVIKQNISEFSSESKVHKNEHSAGKIPVCFLVYREKVRHPSAAKL